MVQVKYFVEINEKGQGRVESILCDWVLGQTEKEEPVLYCYRNGLMGPIAVIKADDVVIICDVFEGSEE